MRSGSYRRREAGERRGGGAWRSRSPGGGRVWLKNRGQGSTLCAAVSSCSFAGETTPDVSAG